ncbi:unnamed protein product [Adineta steineri]|uniref:Uncharacterized protein n=1 Tax=Adineta steineri TaxID=433720 RepID=A0A815P9H3_9BILA|nr:unnamed protein product [Adineta steineri]CAF3899050.1 unnamed protein product [Adineta steineri]
MNEIAKSINDDSTCGCCVPSRVAVYRMRMRSILKIRGNAMNDCCVATHCGLCAAVQMKSELMSRGLAQ